MEQKKVLHIKSLKLKAIWNGLNATGNLVRQKTVAIYADNSTVVACLLSQGGTKSWDLFVLVRDSLLWAEQRQVILIPLCCNMGVFAFSPFAMLGKSSIVQGVNNCRMSLVVPWWPERVWFPDLLESVVDKPSRTCFFSQWGVNSIEPSHSSSDLLVKTHLFYRSGEVSSTISHNIFIALGPSTSVVYQQWWSVYVGWCRANTLSAPCPSCNSCEFFLYHKRREEFCHWFHKRIWFHCHSLLRHTGLQI